MAVIFTSDPYYRGEGISLGLARGLTAWLDGQNVTQEGMGLGTAACKHRHFTYFSSSAAAQNNGDGLFRIRYSLDSRIMWQAGERQSVWLTRLLESAADSYMSVPKLQLPLMAMATLIRKKLRLTARFVPASPVAETTFDYAVRGQKVDIACTVERLNGRPAKIYIMNELGADFFCRSIVKRRVVIPPTGWQPLPFELPTPALYNPEHRVRFYITSLAAAPAVPVRLFWGREKVADYCWAGFEIELDLQHFHSDTLCVRYSVSVE
jgi:hypothetical protein